MRADERSDVTLAWARYALDVLAEQPEPSDAEAGLLLARLRGRAQRLGLLKRP